MKPLLVTSGEPAGIGPDLCLDLADLSLPIVILADKQLLEARAKQLGRKICFEEYVSDNPVSLLPGVLTVLSIPCASPVIPGQLNPENVPYVVNMLSMAADRCLDGEFSALVTAPIHKAIMSQLGVTFTGHTEFFATRFKVKTVVMMLVCDVMRVALVTTHLPLKYVADAITHDLLLEIITCLNTSLQQDFAIKQPKIWVAGLNPHAGEGGHLGTEEIEVMLPALTYLKSQGVDVHGPFPADTLFTQNNQALCDVFLAMYHDQGLPVLKYAGFGNAVNITLGLPIIRTSVDHGTALELAGTGRAISSSLFAAISLAADMVRSRGIFHAN